MLAKVSKWGNSRALRIQKDIALDAGLDFGVEVELRVVDGELRVIPIKELRFTLEELVAGITPENRHAEWDTGPAVGREVW